MNVASLELCKELCELSGWKDTFAWYSGNEVEFEGQAGWDGAVYENCLQYDWCDDVPAYDLGYLLRKLPIVIDAEDHPEHATWLHLRITALSKDKWNFYYERTDLSFTDLPEDAACNLAIELLKQGVLTKETK